MGGGIFDAALEDIAAMPFTECPRAGVDEPLREIRVVEGRRHEADEGEHGARKGSLPER